MHNQDLSQSKVKSEFLSQLAQFSSNNEYKNMPNSLHELVSSLPNQALLASALVGRKVMIYNVNFHLGLTEEVIATIEVPPEIYDLKASIYSEAGDLIKIIPLGRHEQGFLQFSWDGKKQNNEAAPEGIYQIEVRGVSAGEEVFLKTMSTANINSVSLGHNGESLRLNVEGMGTVQLEQVRHISL